MCLQCTTNATCYGEPIPGWLLMQSQADSRDWPKGWWGMVQCNDPSFVWEDTPMMDPIEMIEMVIRLRCHEGPYMIRQKKVDERIALIPEDSKLWTLYREFEERAAKFREIIDKSLSADCSYELVADCSKAGFRTRRHYPKAHDGDVAFWLYHRLGMWLASGRKAVHHSKKPRKFKVLNPRIPKAFMDLIPKGVLANVD